MSKALRKRNRCVDLCLTELERHGVAYTVSEEHKHIHIRFGPEGTLFVTAATPSDTHRAPMNARSDLRGLLREQGLIAETGDVALTEDNPVIVARDGVFRCTSLDVARHFDKQHKDVLRAIDNATADCDAEFNERNFAPITYTDEKNRSFRAFEMTRDGFAFVCMGFTGKRASRWKVRYIEAFNAMEAAASGNLPALEKLREDHEALSDLMLELAGQPTARSVYVPPRITARRLARREARLAA